MKEFSAQTGGRYTYVDDVLNLQELALAFASIFAECENFIVSGCTVSGTSISAGYVYINGKLRYFAGASGISSWPRYIYESNKTENVAYESGSDKVGRTVYGCAIGSSVPTSTDPVTAAVPQYIKLTSAGGLQMKDALYGKYALILDPAVSSQSVNGTVNFKNAVNVSGALTTNGGATVQSGEAVCKMNYNGNVLTIQSRIGSGDIYAINIDNSNGYFTFSVNGSVCCRITNSEFTFLGNQITSTASKSGNVITSGTNVYNGTTASNTGALNINLCGYNGAYNYYRDTVIGDGKNNAIMKLTGSSHQVDINGSVYISHSNRVGVSLMGSVVKTDLSYLKIVQWLDMNSEVMAYMGYNSGANNIFSIVNNVSDISITGSAAVDLGPVIKEGGVQLKDRYALKTDMANALAARANTSNVYSISSANSKFAAKASGFSQFIIGDNTAAALRKQIGAIGSDDMGSYPTIANLLSDMATDESKKQQICDNIGAARAGDFQSKLSDTGWINISSTNLYARQIGNIVCIQGTVTTAHTGNTLFSLPNQISSPRYDVAFRGTLDCNCDWGAKLAGGSRNCTVVYCNHHGKTISFSMSYMI